jgi:hypothetical protein
MKPPNKNLKFKFNKIQIDFKLLFTLLVTLLLSFSSTLIAQDSRKIELPGSASPSFIFFNESKNELNILTAGYDKNFDGKIEKDSGEVYPEWFIIDPDKEIIKSNYRFNFLFDSYPLRVGVNYTDQLLYANIGGEIRVFELSNPQISEVITKGNFSSVYYNNLNKTIYASKRASDFISPGKLMLFNPLTNEFKSELITGINPGMISSIMLNNKIISMVVNEGSFGSKNSSLSIFKDSSKNSVDSIGDGANHIAIDTIKNLAYVTLNGSQSISVISLFKGIVLKSIQVGTLGFDGPRETLLLPNDELIVSTYSGDIRYIKSNGTQRIYKTNGKAESIINVKNKIFVSNAFKTGEYTPESSITVFDFKTLMSSIELKSYDIKKDEISQNYPNPVVSSTRIDLNISNRKLVKLSLFNIKGELIEEFINKELENGIHSILLDLSSLSEGTYYYKMTCGVSEEVVKKLTIIR